MTLEERLKELEELLAKATPDLQLVRRTNPDGSVHWCLMTTALALNKGKSLQGLADAHAEGSTAKFDVVNL